MTIGEVVRPAQMDEKFLGNACAIDREATDALAMRRTGGPRQR